ncbi:MAG TPA: glucose-1-phosphate adenylyltransferase [Gemmataceae bacterium]|nr:glucose-1-phosphate adenylyltransferase [Gemmataceae bacterium]
MQEVLGLILGGGRGERLYPLTKHRSEPAVPLAGKYRLIDIPVSNCINSGVRRVYVLTQFLSVSLHRHIANTYKLSPFSHGFIEVLAAQQTNETADWYQGTAHALRQNMNFVNDEDPRDVLVLSGDQLYRLDFRHLLAAHRERGDDVTIAVKPVARDQARRLGVIRCDAADRIVELVEKPEADADLARLRTPEEWLERRNVPALDRGYLANMGIYLFSRKALDAMLAAQPAAVDLVREIIPRALGSLNFRAYLFDGYWDDLGTVKAYHQGHMALAGDDPPFDFHSPEGVVYTRMRNLPPAHVRGARVEQCVVSDGCQVGAGANLERCVVGVRSRIGRDVVMRETVFNGADRFENDEERAANRRRGLPDFGIGDGCVINRAIIDKDCRIGRDVRVVNAAGVQEADAELYVIRDGIVVIPNGTVVPDGTVI